MYIYGSIKINNPLNVHNNRYLRNLFVVGHIHHFYDDMSWYEYISDIKYGKWDI